MKALTTLLEQNEELNLLTEELSRLYGGKLSFPKLVTDRPFTVVNFVTTIGGLTSFALPGKSGGGYISNFSSEDAFVMGLLRTFADAVAVGANTLRTEPEHVWTADFVSPDYQGLFHDLRKKLNKVRAHPLNIFITGSGKVLPEDASIVPKVFSEPDVETLIITTSQGAEQVRLEFRGRDLAIPQILTAEDKGHPLKVSLSDAFQKLKHSYGIDFLLIEGGATLNGAVINTKLYDEIFLTVSPQVIGTSREHPRPIFVEGFNLVPDDALWHELVSLKIFKDYIFKRYRRK